MKNKILINLYVPSLNQYYDIFIPVNEFVWKTNKLIIKAIHDLSNIEISDEKKYILINVETGMIYQNNDIIINTDIRNYSKLMLIEI